MGITNWSIKHAVTILVLVMVLGLAGWASYQALPREAAPDITIPVVLVTTPYIGVSPSDIETLVTNPIEDELQQLKDVREMRSTSAEGASIVTIEFEPTVDIDTALQKIRERVDAARPDLPADVEDTVITEISFSEFPIMVVNISGDVGLVRLKQMAEQLQDRVERIPGILEVNLVGGLEREIHVEADPELLEFYEVSLGEIIGAIQRENITMPGGSVDAGEVKYTVRVPGEFERVSEIEDLVIREVAERPIRVRDVARVVDGYEERKTISRFNGAESVSLSISRRAGENIPVIADQVKALVAQAQARTGEAVSYAILADVSEDIEEQVSELENNILTGLLLVVAVLLFFMGGLRNALFVAIAIPMSMLISFLVLSALEITLNIVVLFSLVLALGMLVDNAIVIVENIYRHANMGGKTIPQAAMDGVSEVAWPVIASTATTVGAFFPMLFWPGVMGEFMYYLPLMVVIVLTASLFVALVINPVFCALFMKARGRKAGEPVSTRPPEDPLSELEALPRNAVYRAYEATLRFAVRRRWVVGLVSIVVFVGTFMMYGEKNAGVEFFPETTPDRIFVNVTLPEGSNLPASDRVVRSIERQLQAELEAGAIASWVADVGAGTGGQMSFGPGGSTPHQSQITIDFPEPEQRTIDPTVVIGRLREHFESVVGAEIEIAKEGMGPPSGPPVNIELVGEDYELLGALAQKVIYAIRDVEGVVNLNDDFSTGRAEVTVRVNREAAADYGLSTSQVASEVRAAINGTIASVFREGDEEYDIVVRLQARDRADVQSISDLKIKGKDDQLIALVDIARLVEQPGYGSIRHVESDRVVTVGADVTEGANADAILKKVQEVIAAEIDVPPSVNVRYTGQNKDQAEAQTFLSNALLAALFIIALILVTQFNSVMQPVIIIGSVILSLLGVLWMLMLREAPFSVIMTGVGIISLAGVVVNNAIVLIDYTNQLKARGLESREAVVAAGLVRFRPVLLTAVTTLLSLLPIVLGFSLDVQNMKVVYGGRSVEMWGPMANAVVAGLAVATVLTLIVVPVMYSGIDSLRYLPRRISALAPWRRRMSRAKHVDSVDEAPPAPAPDPPAPDQPAPDQPAPAPIPPEPEPEPERGLPPGAEPSTS